MKPDIDSQYSQSVVDHWEQLVGGRERVQHEKWLFDIITTGLACGRILDLATGTGFHLVELASRGHALTGLDSSAAMLETCRRNIDRAGLHATLVEGSWQEIDKFQLDGPYNVVYALGSSIPHLTSSDERCELFQHIRRLIHPEGIFVVDHRNFDYIVAHGEVPPAASPYAGAVHVSVSTATPTSTTFHYSYSDGFTNELTVASLKYEGIREELTNTGFQVTSFADGRESKTIGSAAFGLHVGRPSPQKE